MASRIVGVDIGSDTVRGVEVEDPDGARPRVARMAEVPIPPGSVLAGEVREVQTFASALKRLWSLGGFRTKRVVLGVGNSRVLARELSLPRMPLKQVREALPFQVQEMLPVPVADAILDFYPAAEVDGESGPMLRGLLIAALKEAVTAGVTAVRLAGLQVVAVDLIPFALARLLTDRSIAETVALIDLGATTTNVVITTAGVPGFVRILPSGGAEVTKALADRFSLTPERAEGVKHALGLGRPGASPDELQAIEVIQSSTGTLLNGLRDTISYYVSQHPSTPVSRIVITGGGARMPGLLESFSGLTRLPVSYAAPFQRLEFGRRSAPNPDSRHGVAVALAVGSAA